MKRTGIDSNILLRALLDDDPVQSPVARSILEKLARDGSGFVGISALLETFWVMRSRYKIPRETICDTIRAMLRTEGLDMESADAVTQALVHFEEGKVDFPDALLALRNLEAGCASTLTFDKRAARAVPGMELLA